MTKQAKNSLQNAKFRVVAALVVVIAIVFTVIVIWRHHSIHDDFKSSATVSPLPSIESLPGAGDPSEAYVRTQNLQNALQAAEARKKVTSFVPTITRSSFIGSPTEFEQAQREQPKSDEVGKCSIDKNLPHRHKTNAKDCTVENLVLARNAGVSAEELLCQSCSCPALRLAGYTAGELKNVGYSAEKLVECGFDLSQLKAAGFTVKDLKAANFTADQLKKAGFSAGELTAAGYTIDQIKKAGYLPTELPVAEVPDCSLDALKTARSRSVSAKELKEKGCGLAALKAAGFSAASLKQAGFSDADLKKVGFSPDEIYKANKISKICNVAALKAARNQGISADVLKQKGCGITALKAAGFSAKELKKAGFSAEDLSAAGLAPMSGDCSVEALKRARLEGVSATALKAKGCGIAALKAAGFTAAELKNAGFTAAELKAAGFNARDLKDAGFSASELKKNGLSATDLKKAGFSAEDLKSAGFKPSALKAAGFDAKALADAGFSASDLKEVGFGADALKNAGFNASELKAAGFNAGDLKTAGFDASPLKAAGFNAKDLRDAGFSAGDLKGAQFTTDQMRKAGYTKGNLLRAGYSEQEAGYSPPASAAPAVTQGKTLQKPVIPSMESNHNDDDFAATANASIPSIEVNSTEGRIRALQQAQQERLNQQEHRDIEQQLEGQMGMQARNLMANWSNQATQTYQVGLQKTMPLALPGEANNNNGQARALNATGPIIKAGTVSFARLDTGINSDEVSPILATVVSGELKGAKLIGKFNRVDKRILIQFDLINLPNVDHTVAINAVAIDQNTARTAIAGDLNNHYLLRYGTLFASSFLAGVGNGVMQSGSTVLCNWLGTCNVTRDKMNYAEYAALGLGNVGQEFSAALAQNVNTPPTIKIASGTAIGLLFTSDFTLPQPLPKSNNYN